MTTPKGSHGAIHPTIEEFRAASARGNLIPVCREVLADLETPVSLYRKLSAGARHSFLLESVENGLHVGRYSFLGSNPFLVFRAKGEQQELLSADGMTRPLPRGPLLESLRQLMAPYRAVHDARMPPFTGGAVGFLGYDVVRHFEKLPDSNPDTLSLPDCLFMLADELVAFDHVKRRLVLIVNAHVGMEGPDAAYRQACARLERLQARVRAPMPPPSPTTPADGPARSCVERPEFLDAVRRAKEYIAAGDIFQVVLSQRFSKRLGCDPFDVYRALRAVNPSPYMFHLRADDLCISGSSPELLVSCQDGRLTLRPIAGTRPRGTTEAEDKQLEKDLLADTKELAEHLMLVDLGRNDLGRVARYGTVKVEEFQVIERYSHVMHIVSTVTADLAQGKDGFDVLRATFPAGTLTGAPKIRAMEIIDELETTRRGPYGGAVVYVGFDGNMDSCITIRTAVIKDDQVHVQAGAGVVADSDPEREFEETVNKSAALLRAIEMAEEGL